MISRRTSVRTIAFAVLALVAGVALGWHPNEKKADSSGDSSWFKTPFMDVFSARRDIPKTVVSSHTVNVGDRSMAIYLARPEVEERLPAILLFPPRSGLDDWIQKAARNMSETRMVVLAVDYDPQQLADASPLVRQVAEEQILSRMEAAVDWAAKQKFADPHRIGAVAWSDGCGPLLKLQKRRPLQGVVVCGDGRVKSSLLQTKHVPVMWITGSRDAGVTPDILQTIQNSKLPHRLHIAQEAGGAFMEPQNKRDFVEEAAEIAWVEMYHFIGHNVEDADHHKHVDGAHDDGHTATISHLMQVLLANSGMRGKLSQSLLAEPTTDQDWRLAEARAAVLAETENLLVQRRPHQGDLKSWRIECRKFGKLAAALLNAVKKRDHQQAQQQLRLISKSCASCHSVHR